MKRILIAAPLRQDVGIFDEYQAALRKLKLPEGYEADRFFVVNDCPEVFSHLKDCKFTYVDFRDEYEKTENDHLWTMGGFKKMEKLRDSIINVALKGGYDYLFSVDTDLVLGADTLLKLLADDKDIVSGAFFTTSACGEWCNAWMYDQCDSDGNLQRWKEPGLYRVGMTGACTLIKRKVLEAGVRYKGIGNIRSALIGEDRNFCIRADVMGFEMWLDSTCDITHLYTEEDYKNYLKTKERI